MIRGQQGGMWFSVRVWFWGLFLLACWMVSARDASTTLPGIARKKRPQLIVFTHDDNTDPLSAKYVNEILKAHRNPNGCKIKGVFFTTASLSNCSTVLSLYNNGHEIAEHTKNHYDLYRKTKSYEAKENQILGGRDYIVSCGVPKDDVVGHRSPYLSSSSEVRKILNENGYLYDATIPEYYPSKTSPSSKKLTFPYQMDNGIPQDCNYWGNINHCTKSETHPGLWEIPLYQYQKGPYTASTNDLMDPENALKNLRRDFRRRYKGNRAPLGIWTHTTTGYLKKSRNRRQISKFLKYALSKPDVWVVTARQLIEYMENPVKASEMKSFLGKYKGC